MDAASKPYRRAGAALVVAVLTWASTAHAQLVVYPAKGQSAEQQAKDEVECQVWARGQTGVDPAALAVAPQPTAAGPGGQRVRGAARGAALGAVGGAIAGDAGTGAAAGAAVGAVGGGMRRRQERRQASAQAEQAQAQTQTSLATFNRAYSACLEGRGYTVK